MRCVCLFEEDKKRRGVVWPLDLTFIKGQELLLEQHTDRTLAATPIPIT